MRKAAVGETGAREWPIVEQSEAKRSCCDRVKENRENKSGHGEGAEANVRSH